VARPLDLDQLLEHFTLADDELVLLRNKSGATRLGFSLLLKYLAWKGRFPRGRGEIPDNAVDHIARQVGVPPEELGLYDWSGRQTKRHRVEVRRHLGFRECSVADADKLTAWLAAHVAQRERQAERVREELLAHCHAERIEPPTAGRVDRMVASALRQAEEVLSVRIASRLSTAATVRLEELVAAAPDDAGADEGEQEAEGAALLALIKSDPGNVSLESMLTEIGKLEAVRLVDLLIATVHRINARAERRRSCSGSRGPPSITPTTPSGPRCFRWCPAVSGRCGTWSPSTSSRGRPTAARCRPP
jgi:hypothetical protein